jgi:hypothetical protein
MFGEVLPISIRSPVFPVQLPIPEDYVRLRGMDMVGFLSAFVIDYVSLMSGIASLLLTVIGLRQSEASRKKWFRGAALICFVIASARVWTTEHRKVLGQTAFLDASVEPFWPKQSFPANETLTLNLTWEDLGAGPATKTRKAAKIYVLDAVNNQAEDRAIQDWKSYWKEVQSTATPEETVDLYPHKPRSIIAEGPRLTEQTARDVFIDNVKTIAVIGAIRFTDGAGEHEGHACKWLNALQQTKAVWSDCHSYVTQVDIK